MSEENVYSEKEVDQIVAKYRTLCARAADALVFYYRQTGVHPVGIDDLFAELRKAAE